jgi:uncharacterized membrane protein
MILILLMINQVLLDLLQVLLLYHPLKLRLHLLQQKEVLQEFVLLLHFYLVLLFLNQHLLDLLDLRHQIPLSVPLDHLYYHLFPHL